MKIRGLFAAGLIVCFAAGAGAAEWYQSYDKGYKAADKGKCDEAIPLLKEALSKQPTPDLKARPYGVITLEYIPHFYLAKCAIAAGDFNAAKEYMDAAMEIDMYSSSKSAEFRKMQKQVEDKLGSATTAKPTTPAKPPGPTTTTPSKPPANTPPTKDPGAERLAVISRVLNEAKISFAAGDYDGAKDSIDRVLVLDRSNQEALSLKSQIQEKEAAATAARIKQQKIADARRALSRGDFASAETSVLELKIRYPGDSAVQSLAGDVERAKSEKLKSMQADDSRKLLERQVINAFYTGRYNAVVELADQAVQQHPQSWRLLFFQGCAYAALSLLEEKNHDDRLSRARDSFRRAKAAAGTEITQPPQISPKIWDVFKNS